MKPNSGVVDPYTEVSIAIGLQPFQFNPNEEIKFMVQSILAPENGEINLDNLVSGFYCLLRDLMWYYLQWKEADQKDMMKTKLQFVFTSPYQEQNQLDPPTGYFNTFIIHFMRYIIVVFGIVIALGLLDGFFF